VFSYERGTPVALPDPVALPGSPVALPSSYEQGTPVGGEEGGGRRGDGSGAQF